MKLSANDATIIARILERYMIYAERFMEKGFGAHPESLRNTNLFVETAEDIGLITRIYPAFAGGKTIAEAVIDRSNTTMLPDPTKLIKANPIPATPEDQHFRSLLDSYPGSPEE